MKKKATAYTLGNPDRYEPYMDEDFDEPPMKAPGGVVYRTRKEAEAMVADGFLPKEWFDGKKIPGRVYGLLCDPEKDTETCDYGLCLLDYAELVRVQ